MIRFSLSCDHGHDFEGWFSTGADFDRQVGMGLVSCPVCQSVQVSKLLMAPSVTTARQKEATQMLAMTAAHKQALAKIREAVAEIKANAEDVGSRFPDEARKIHYGEADARGIIGQASAEEARALVDEGIEISPFPVLPDDVN